LSWNQRPDPKKVNAATPMHTAPMTKAPMAVGLADLDIGSIG
jgi:hypothetical protein